MEMQLQTKDTLATLHLDPRTKLYLLIVGNVALFLAPSLLYEIALVVCVVILGILVGAKRFTVRMAAVYAGMVVLHHQHQFLSIKVHGHPSLSYIQKGCIPGHHIFLLRPPALPAFPAWKGDWTAPVLRLRQLCP